MIRSSTVRAFVGNEHGIALVEFAVSLPFLLLLYLGGYQLCDALSCKRKVTIATRAVADLTSQYSQVATADLTSVMSASKTIMAPYDVSKASIQLSQVTTDTSGNTTVSWSVATSAQPLAKGSSYTLPPALKVNGTSLIVSKIVFAYTPAVTFSVVQPVTFGDTIYMSPRKTDQVSCSDC